MRIVWDEPKRQKNIQTHEMDFADLHEDFFAEALILAAKHGRLKAIGYLQPHVIAVVFVMLGSEGLSVISMRRASRQERILYAEDRSGH